MRYFIFSEETYCHSQITTPNIDTELFIAFHMLAKYRQ